MRSSIFFVVVLLSGCAAEIEIPFSPVEGDECKVNWQCDDDNRYTEDTCDFGYCISVVRELEDTAPGGICCREDNDDDGFGRGDRAWYHNGETCPDLSVSCRDRAPADCNDEDPDTRPFTVEICYDGIDNDCDGFGRDREESNCQPPPCNNDSDCRYFNNGEFVFHCSLGHCELGAGSSDDDIFTFPDCGDDSDNFLFTPEICGDGIDNDCDGEVDEDC